MAKTVKADVVLVEPRHWWALLALGLFQIAGGVLALVYTDITLLALGLIFGVNLLLAGGILVVLGAGDESTNDGVKAVRIMVGMLAVLGGLLCLVRPGASVLVLLLCVGFFFLLTGVSSLAEAATSKRNRLVNTILGLAGIAAGVILVADPDIGLATLADLAGILLIARGGVEFLAGLYLKTQT